MKLESQMILIFGGTGDLTRRKLIPSLYHLLRRRRLALCTPVVCIGRKQLTRDQFLESLQVEKYIESADSEVIRSLCERIEYLSFDSTRQDSDDFTRSITELEHKYGCTPNKLIYLALPTTVFGGTAKLIGSLERGEGWRRVVFEKPFGTDQRSAQELNDQIASVLREEEIYRVDHYLGKELVRNILTLRFGNAVFESSWCADGVDHVQITVSESLGVEQRAGYYDKSGAVRDMVQNHLLQLLSLVAMEPPVDGSPDALRDESVQVLKSLRLLEKKDVVLGQYGPGHIEGDKVCGYRDEEGVVEGSTTETFVALRAHVESPRWNGVPFYLRTGKRLKKRYAEIRVVLKQQFSPVLGRPGEPNVIVIRIQPDEGIGMTFNVRNPGESAETSSVLMDFCHHCHFGPNSPEAYESILNTVMQGDHAIFPRWDWIEESWKYVDNLYRVAGEPLGYPAGSNGPDEASRLLEQDGRSWIEDDSHLQLASFPRMPGDR